jgi:acetyl-CoA carboxylase biotin carboxyl carrier protein
MDLDKIQQLLRIVAESDVAEVSVEEDDFKITIRKKSPEISMQPSSFMPTPYPMPMQGAGYPVQAPQAAAQQPTGAPGTTAGAAPQETAEESGTAATAEQETGAEADTDEEVVRAPLVGTFYRRPAPDEDAFVEVGDTIEVGQVICIIEAMKIMNEIESDAAGRVKEIFVDDGESVEYDQPLFVIESA